MNYRKAYHCIERALSSEHRVILLLGLRRTGKTTILQQLAQNHNGLYVDFRSGAYTATEYYELFEGSEDLLLFDEIGYLEDFDVFFGRMLSDLDGTNKKVVITGSVYGVLGQLAREEFGGGRAYKIELFPLDFEEYLLFSGKIFKYNDSDFKPSTQDVWDYFRLKGVPAGMDFIIDEQYMYDTFTETQIAYQNKDGKVRDIQLDELECRSIIDLLAYTLNQPVLGKRIQGQKQVGVQELGKDVRGLKISNSIIGLANRSAGRIGVTNIARIVAYLYTNGFLFADLSYNEDGSESPNNIVTDFLSVQTVLDLEACLNKYTLSVVSPLFYTRLMINLETMADIIIEDKALLGQIYELSLKTETIYKMDYSPSHHTYKYTKNNIEVDVCYGNLLLECSVGHKRSTQHNVNKVFEDMLLIRVLTDSEPGINFMGGYYHIGHPEALLMLSNNSILNLNATTIGNSALLDSTNYFTDGFPGECTDDQ